jgi:hypothetical protein
LESPYLTHFCSSLDRIKLFHKQLPPFNPFTTLKQTKPL